jgi:hypothetical protein
VAVVIGVVVIFFHFRRRKYKIKSSKNDIEVAVASVEYEEVTCKEMSIKEIYAATENLRLSNIIGQGIAGTI